MRHLSCALTGLCGEQSVELSFAVLSHLPSSHQRLALMYKWGAAHACGFLAVHTHLPIENVTHSGWFSGQLSLIYYPLDYF